MTNYLAGHAAEQRAARYLQDQGFKLRELNWHNKLAEIDIVAEKDGRIFFVEVKYRRNNDQGDGFDYITKAKLKHMQRAANFWIGDHSHQGEVTLAALSVSGDEQYEFIEIDS
ncbi:MAG: YraN family protein [Patescibacteria group bacterium]